MRYWFFFIVFVKCCLFANTIATTENDPNSFVEGVNVITGDYFSIQEDVLVQGVEPISLRRCYVSQKGEGTWGFHNYHKAIVHSYRGWVKLTEPNGTVLHYNFIERRKGYVFSLWDPSVDARGFSNTARGSLSARNNLKNQYLSMPEDQKTFTVHCPDGTERVYHRNIKRPKSVAKKFARFFKTEILGKEGSGLIDYLLIEERLPNGHKILYEWPEGEKDVWQIKSCDKTGKVIYAWVRFYPKKAKESPCEGDYGVETSDGRHFEYKYFEHNGSYQLKEIRSDEKPSKTTLHYVDYGDKKILNAITWKDSRSFNLNYYGPRDGDAICFRVKELFSPVGSNRDNIITHRFHYDVGAKKTTVLDAYLNPTDYYWDDNLRLIRIDRFLDKNRLYNREKFVWGKNESQDLGCLVCKVLFDGEGNAISATRYSYDKRGNVRKERFYGNLSGSGVPLVVDEEGFPLDNGVECYTKRYHHSKEQSLLLKQEEDNGFSMEYDYLDNTPLMKEERVYDKGTLKTRKTYEYNQDRILIREITHDVLSNIKLIRKITLKQHTPYIGLPEIIEEQAEDAKGIHTIKKVKLHYTTGGRVTCKEVYDSEGEGRYQEVYRYKEGCLVEEVDAMGYLTRNTYDDFGNKTCIRPPTNVSEIITVYDYSNRPFNFMQLGKDVDRHNRYTYNFLHQKVTHEDEWGQITSYVYDPFGHVLETHLPGEKGKEAVLTSTYNAAGQEICHIDARGYKTERSYNAYGYPTRILYPDGAEESFTYYLDGKVETHKDQNGVITSYFYDGLGQLISKESAFSKESFIYKGLYLMSHTDPEGRVTTYSYDAAGRKVEEKLGQEITLYSYDPLGRQDKIITCDLVQRKKYDLLDRVTHEQKENIHGQVFEVISYEYDEVGNKIKKEQSIDGKTSKEVFIYDAAERLVKHIDPLNHETTTAYHRREISPEQRYCRINRKVVLDPLGLQTISEFNEQAILKSLEKKDSKGKRIIQELYEYDLSKNLIKKTTILPERRVSTCWKYDSMNRIEQLIEAAGTSDEKITSYTYTPKGLLWKTTKPSGIILTNTYNELNQLILQTSSDGTIAYEYTYDKTGLLLASKDLNTQEQLTRKYDLKGRVEKETLSNGLIVKNKYDSLGRRKRITLPNNSSVIYEYDNWYLQRICRYDVNSTFLYSHTYEQRDLSGHILEEALPGFLGSLKHHYDVLGSHVEVSSSKFSHKALAFDPVHNLIEDLRQGVHSTYSYDNIYQLVSENAHRYSYDALHNRTKKDDEEFSINALNQTGELSYDKDGNPSFLRDRKLSYDAFDRLISIEDSHTRTVYSYDALHRRISKKVYLLDGRYSLVSEIYYLYDGQNEIGAFDSSGLSLELRILGETPYAELGSAIALELYGKIYVPFYDLQGNMAALYSLDDNTLEEYCYTAFGEELFLPPLSQNPWRFASKRIDPESGLIFYGRRYYLPEKGRWLTSDPLGFQAGPNLYAFVFNSPLTHMDLYGLEALPADIFDEKFMLREGYAFSQDFRGPVPKWVGEEHPSLYFGFSNGIQTKERVALRYTAQVSDYAGGIKTVRIYNPSDDLPRDLIRSALGIFDIGVDGTEEIKQEMIQFYEKHKGTNHKMFWVAHSRGAIPLYNALARVSKEVQQMCIVLAIAPAKVIPKRLCFDSFNYVSKRDIVPIMGAALRDGLVGRGDLEGTRLPKEMSQEMMDLKELIWLDPHPNAAKFDHDFLSPTFELVMKKHIKEYIENFGGK